MSGPEQTGRRQKWLVGHTKEAVGGRGAKCPEKKLTKRVCSMETGTGRNGCPFSSITAHLLAAHTEIQRSVMGAGEGEEGRASTPIWPQQIQLDLGTQGPRGAVASTATVVALVWSTGIT